LDPKVEEELWVLLMEDMMKKNLRQGCLRTDDKGILKKYNLKLLMVLDRGKFFNSGLAFGWKGVSLRNGILP
jgi:hypothetical protein